MLRSVLSAVSLVYKTHRLYESILEYLIVSGTWTKRMLVPAFLVSSYDKRDDLYGMIYVLERRTVYGLTKGLHSNKGNKHQNNPRVGALTVRHVRAYINSFLPRHNDSINDDKNDDLHTLLLCLTRSAYVLLTTSQSIDEDNEQTIVTQSREEWYIDCIHGDIHGRSSKKFIFSRACSNVDTF